MLVFAATCVPCQTTILCERKEASAGRDFSPQEYEKLRVNALSAARVKLVSKLTNPTLSQNGVDRKIMAALEQQRAYLERTPPVADPRLTTELNNGQSPARLAVTPRSDSALAETAVRSNTFGVPPCTHPQIRSVNGKVQSAVFTPQLPDNVYRIEGCMFGTVPGQIQLEPHPGSRERSALPIRMLLKPVSNSWSDNEIVAYLDDRISGVLDAPVTLVIFPGKGRRVELAGCFFLARRGAPRLLNRLPASWVKLQVTTRAVRGIKQLEYVSPPQAQEGVPNRAHDTSAVILRSDSIPFESGADEFELSRLNSGWRVESMQVEGYVVSCPGDVVQASNYGKWAATWNDDGVKISWAAEMCRSYIPPQFSFELSTSLYALRIRVVGPTGTEPIGTK
jgi:hypothetical protein